MSTERGERMIIVGIDPGLDGGIAVMGKIDVPTDWLVWWERKRNILVPMPTVKDGKKRVIDEGEVANLVGWGAGTLVVIEKVHAMPKQGVTSMFNFGLGYGLIRGICSGLGLRYQLVTPQAWQKVMLKGRGRDAKYEVAHELWPDVDFRATERCRKPHTGMVDAALICEWGRRTGGAN